MALLRGVNVGGKNLLPMKDLSRLFEEAGCANVRTYIQSGNVLFSASPAKAAKLPGTDFRPASRSASAIGRR